MARRLSRRTAACGKDLSISPVAESSASALGLGNNGRKTMFVRYIHYLDDYRKIG
jgi:hypothetical protein